MRLRILCAVFAIVALAAAATAGVTPDASHRRRAIRIPAPCTSFSVAADHATDIAVDETHLYFGDNDGNVHRVSKRGGTPSLVVNIPGSWIIFIAVDAEQVYFLARERATNKDTVRAVAKGGGVPILLSDVGFVYEMISDGEWLYLVHPGTYVSGSMWKADGRLLRVRTDGSATETLAAPLRGPVGLLIDGDDLYFSERGTDPADQSGGLRRMPKAGGPVTKVADIPGALMLTGDTTHLFAFRIEGSDRGALDMVPKSGGAAVQLASGVYFETFQPLTVLGDSVYFGDLVSGNTVKIDAIRPATGERRTVSTFQGGFPQIAIDSCGVYYSTPTTIERGGL